MTYRGGHELIANLLRAIVPCPVETANIPGAPSVDTFAEVERIGKQNEKGFRISRRMGQSARNRGELAQAVEQKTAAVVVLDIPSVDEASQQALDAQFSGYVKGMSITADAIAVIKTDVPEIFRSSLLDTALEVFKGGVILTISLNTLRLVKNVPTIESLSWESCAQGINEALRHATADRKSAPMAIVVSILSEGCLINYPLSGESELVYDPVFLEGERERATIGRMAGYAQTICVAIAAGLVGGKKGRQIADSACLGLAACVKLLEVGLTIENEECVYPVALLADAIKSSDSSGNPRFSRITVPAADEVNWSILKAKILRANPQNWRNLRSDLGLLTRSNPVDMLRQLGVPMSTFGDYVTFIRDEIESFTGIRDLINEYAGRKNPKRPLCIAVFGPPGSGKSFGVKQIAQSLTKKGLVLEEFNLSQFSAPEDLYAALHRVRDRGLSGKLPVVFWDEFDCEFQGTYGWLRYFLAPMQDGKFAEGETTHSVGRAIFVFAGGTRRDMDSFSLALRDQVAAKGPDFLSRLHGFIDVQGLDHDEILLGPVLVRRAVLLRSFLLHYAPSIVRGGQDLQIDDAIIDAFLCIQRFKHGARSMEALITMCTFDGRGSFQPSCLPTSRQAALHVDMDEWNQLLRGVFPSGAGGAIGW